MESGYAWISDTNAYVYSGIEYMSTMTDYILAEIDCTVAYSPFEATFTSLHIPFT